MVKSGIFKSKSGKEYLVYHYDSNSFTRFDIIATDKEYDIGSTDNCDASYYKKKVIKVLGDKELIAEYQAVIKQANSFIGHQTSTLDKSEDGALLLVTVKEDKNLGIMHKSVLKGRLLESEYCETKIGSVDYKFISNNAYDDLPPFNVDHYENIGFDTNISKIIKKNIKATGRTYYTAEELLRQYPALSHIYKNDYVVISSYEEAEKRLKDWINSKQQLKSVDIESLHTQWGIGSDNRITGVFLGYGEVWSTYFPFRQDNFKYNLPIEFLRKIFDAVNNQPAYPTVIILAHNAKFELEGFYQEFNEWLRVDIDTFILSVLVDPLIKSGTHTLKVLGAKVDGNFYVSLKQVFFGKVEFNVLPEDVVLLYGCPDATTPAKIFPYLMKRLPKDEVGWMHKEMELIKVKAFNEFIGLRLDQEKLDELIRKEQDKIDILSEKFKRIHRTSKNINSPDVMRNILYNKLRIPVEIYTNKNLPSTSKAAIERALELGTIRDYDKDNIPDDIRDSDGTVLIAGKDLAANKYYSLVIYQKYKKAVKELGALNRLKKKSLHGYFKFYINQVGAGSNRQTSDAQQFSSTMKGCAIADSPSHGLVSSDWSQVELRILAWLAQEKPLINLASITGVDLHRAILSIILNRPIWDISEEERQSGKAVNFGVVYLMTEYGLVRKEIGPKYTKEELNMMRDKITNFYNSFPAIKAFLAKQEENLLTKNYVKTAFGYYRFFKELGDPTISKKLRNSLIKSGTNTPIQGTGAQMLKLVEIAVFNYCEEKGWNKLRDYNGVMLPMVRSILPIHDELLISWDQTRLKKEDIIHMLRECMEIEIEGAPPFFACPAFINNWYEGKDPAFEIPTELRDKIDDEYKKGNYILSDSGMSYYDYLVKYREDEIYNYMMGLKEKYVTAEEITKHVTHESLTHTLIEAMLPKKERVKFTHRERIAEAVNRWLEKNKDGAKPVKSIMDIVTVTDKYDNAYLEAEGVDVESWESSYVRFDENGDLVEEVDYNNYGEEVEEDTIFRFERDRQVTEAEKKIDHVFYIGYDCCIDLTGYDFSTDGQIIYNKILANTNPNGGYRLVLISGNKTVMTKHRIDYIPDVLEDLFKVVV